EAVEAAQSRKPEGEGRHDDVDALDTDGPRVPAERVEPRLRAAESLLRAGRAQATGVRTSRKSPLGSCWPEYCMNCTFATAARSFAVVWRPRVSVFPGGIVSPSGLLSWAFRSGFRSRIARVTAGFPSLPIVGGGKAITVSIPPRYFIE